MGKIYENDYGTVIDLDVGEDVSAATTFRIYYTKPSGTTGYWTASLQGTNKLRYTTQNGDLNEDGVWSLQARVSNGSSVWHGETVKLRVYALYE